MTLTAIVVLRLGRYLDLVSDLTGMVLGAALGVPFLLSAVPLIVYRVRYGA